MKPFNTMVFSNMAICFRVFCFVKTTKTNWRNFLSFQNGIKLGDKLKSCVNNDTLSTAINAARGFKERFEKPS